jgi:hypothetical protein
LDTIPLQVYLLFSAVVIAVILFLFFAFKLSENRNAFTNRLAFTFLLGWPIIVFVFTWFDFFLDFKPPPRLMLFVAFPVLITLALLAFPSSRKVLHSLPITVLTHIHIIRIPVEIVLWWLAIQGVVNKEMTFEGANFDILSGITAPAAAIFLFGKNLNRRGAIIWNLIALGLLFNIVIRAISLTPYFYDGEYPNVAVFYFPFILLPTLVVPAVLFSHLVSLNQLFFKREVLQ